MQSGDDDVLRQMNRHYRAEDFEHVVSESRRALPLVTVATDVIVGFPDEDERAFENTVELIGKIQPDIVNVSKFFARPSTPAAEMSGKVDAGELKRRSEVLAGIVKPISLEKNKAWVGWSGKVLIDESGKKPGSWVGRNFAYKPVVVYSDEALLGRVLDVRIVDAFQSHLVGEVV